MDEKPLPESPPLPPTPGGDSPWSSTVFGALLGMGFAALPYIAEWSTKKRALRMDTARYVYLAVEMFVEHLRLLDAGRYELALGLRDLGDDAASRALECVTEATAESIYVRPPRGIHSNGGEWYLRTPREAAQAISELESLADKVKVRATQRWGAEFLEIQPTEPAPAPPASPAEPAPEGT